MELEIGYGLLMGWVSQNVIYRICCYIMSSLLLRYYTENVSEITPYHNAYVDEEWAVL